MQYRRFGGLDWRASALGFGAMRLPQRDGEIDETRAVEMVRYAVDRGLNYIDTAYVYHGGQSEVLLGRALRDGYRERVKIATKLPCWSVASADDVDRILDEQLERLQMGGVDFYLMHGMGHDELEKMRGLGVLARAEKALADGRIKRLGFSSHDDTEGFIRTVDGYDGWTMCQIQYNYMDVDNQAGVRGLKHAFARGLAVVVMEPLLGGKLTNPPQAVRDLWETAPRKRTPVDWALQWLWHQPEVSTVLSGMSDLTQVEENLASAERSDVGTLTEEEMQLAARVADAYRSYKAIPCTGCRYCMPCPNEVDIPGNLENYNEGIIYNAHGHVRFAYRNWLKKPAKACTQCHQCEEKCPQRIPIADWMRKIDAALGQE